MDTLAVLGKVATLCPLHFHKNETHPTDGLACGRCSRLSLQSARLIQFPIPNNMPLEPTRGGLRWCSTLTPARHGHQQQVNSYFAFGFWLLR